MPYVVEAGVGVGDAGPALGSFLFTTHPLGWAGPLLGTSAAFAGEVVCVSDLRDGVQGFLETSLLSLPLPDCLFSVPNDLLFLLVNTLELSLW
jgi:hypothetical protein